MFFWIAAPLISAWSIGAFIALIRGEDTEGTPRGKVWFGAIGSLVVALAAWAIVLGLIDPNQ